MNNLLHCDTQSFGSAFGKGPLFEIKALKVEVKLECATVKQLFLRYISQNIHETKLNLIGCTECSENFKNYILKNIRLLPKKNKLFVRATVARLLVSVISKKDFS